MARNYHPYDTESFKELMNICYRMGWYPGRVTLFTVKMIGQFEGHGRASETWEHDFEVELGLVKAEPEQGVVNIIFFGGEKPALTDYARQESLPGGRFRGRTLEEACQKAVKAIKEFRKVE